MIVPVTTGGKKRSSRLMNGAIRIATTPAPMIGAEMPRARRRGRVGHRDHRADRGEGHAHHHRQPDAERAAMPKRLDERDDAADEQVGRDQERHLLAAGASARGR